MDTLFFMSLVLFVGLALAVPNPILRGSPGLRYEDLTDPDGVPHLVDSWLKLSDLKQTSSYDPDRDNQYHLFTRANPTISQPLLNENEEILNSSNFNPERKTVFVIHGWMGSATAPSNTVLVPALLTSEDVNVIVLDWSIGALEPSIPNALASARSVARFIDWLGAVAGVTGDDLIVIGFSLGGQQAGMIGRYVSQNVSYVMALDPPKRGFDFEFKADDAAYTEVIHTAVSYVGHIPIGQVDFYPNGGDNNPGCGDISCNHSRAYFFIAESLVRGGFTGVECATYQHALNGTCNLPRTLNMGGLKPKTGNTGIFYLETNAAPPFSRG